MKKQEPVIPLYEAPQVKTQLLVLLTGSPTPVIINPEDEVTKDGYNRRLTFPDILLQLTCEIGWVDVWNSMEHEDGSSSRLAVRLLARNVVMLTQGFVYPSEQDMVQS